ncbi:hypothetical protein SpiGrapes_1782 [Sphaerochaeta pleomorpha str. Grapes]|uniref:Uncharacterized protein n=1 Tax=Sphaerochaeta pleomorpha (strain ATCC BAA-1885 / DSM 22778 / Grapes) TaxID=158190 RepID=G8QXL5_SPHPG|nr:hypothetical protein SpiGrapes_1782 [Sphaerochaeta pleomorpha str. Grapes]
MDRFHKIVVLQSKLYVHTLLTQIASNRKNPLQSLFSRNNSYRSGVKTVIPQSRVYTFLSRCGCPRLSEILNIYIVTVKIKEVSLTVVPTCLHEGGKQQVIDFVVVAAVGCPPHLLHFPIHTGRHPIIG